MSKFEDHSSSKCDNNGKNELKICCQYCPSIVINKGASTMIEHEFPLPYMRPKNEADDEKQETINIYWLIEDMYTFENVSVTKTVGDIKYLACADCEVGPIGYMDLSTKKSYVAISRVVYKDTTN